jgi:hypothetical protein
VVSSLAKASRLVRDRAFYPTVLLVIASYYVLFAAMAASVHALIVEAIVMTASSSAIVGFKGNAWTIVVGLAAHGLFDAVHGAVLHNAGGTDLVSGLLSRGRRRSRRLLGMGC